MNRTATTNHGIAMHGYIRWWIAYRFLVKPLLSWHSSERSSICVRCSLNSASLSNRSISADQRRCLSHYHKLVDFSQIAEGKDRSGVESKPTVCRQEVQKWNTCRRALKLQTCSQRLVLRLISPNGLDSAHLATQFHSMVTVAVEWRCRIEHFTGRSGTLNVADSQCVIADDGTINIASSLICCANRVHS